MSITFTYLRQPLNRYTFKGNFCPIATMNDMLEIVEWAEKIVTFG